MTRNKKTLLIYPPSLRAVAHWRVFFSVKFPLLSIFSHLRSQGLEVEVLDLEAELGRPDAPADVDAFLSRAKELIAARDFDVAAVSCYTSFEYTAAMEIGKACRSVRPDAWLVAGGYHPSSLPEDFTGSGSPFDFVITGEAEIVLAELARGAAGKGEAQVRVLKGKPLALTDQTELDFESYPYARRSGACSVGLSRGCPFECAFCIEPALGSGWRTFSVEKSLSLLDRAMTAGAAGMVLISDPIFGFSKSWRREFLTALIRRKKDVVIGASCRVDMLDREDLDLLSRLNMVVQMGVETASPRMVRRMKKAANPDLYLKKVAEVLSYASRKDVLIGMNLLFNHPGETPETYRETLSFIESLTDSVSKASYWPSCGGYRFFPGAPEFYGIEDYEKNYGTKVMNKTWWKSRRGESTELELAVVASRETESAFGTNYLYWEPGAAALQEQVRAKASPKQKMWMCQSRLTEIASKRAMARPILMLS